jgi:zinc/manganese transport system substrate-binding protein
MNIVMQIVLSLFFAAAAGNAPAYSEEAKIKVIATNSILADWARNVGQDKVDVQALVGPNSDIHTFEPTPQTSIALTKSQVVLSLGQGLEPWLKDLYKSSASKAHRYVVGDGLDLIHLVKTEGMFRDEVDPHFWHDPTKAIRVVQTIATSFVNEDAANAQYYWENANSYIAELVQLDEWIAKEIRKIPIPRKKIVTSHDTFAYFAKRYGFEVIGSVIDSATTEAADPSAQKIAELVKRVKAAGVPAVFLENVSNSKVAESVANEAGVKLAPKLYSDALGEEGSPADTYIKMMKYNVQVFVDALRK